MRYRLMATYLGVLYRAGLGPAGTEVTLFSPAPPPEELGFAAADGHWRKQVGVTDLGALWQSRPTGEYRGEPCLVLDDFGERLHIAYLGRDSARAAQLGYWEIDREVFEVVVARHDVTSLTEERVDFPLAAAMFPVSRAEPEAAGPQAAEPQAAGPQAPAVLQAAVVAEPGGSQPSAESAAGHVIGGPTGNGSPAGYGLSPGGADHALRAPDRVTAWHGSPAPGPWPVPGPKAGTPPGRRTGHKDRISPEAVFAELLSLSAIPQDSYAVDEEVPGAMCLIKTDDGFEVFGRTEDARLEVCSFEDEEAAYFYLFGVLAAEAVRSGRLRPGGPEGANGHGDGASAPGTPSASTGNVSKYLRGRNLPKSPSRPARVE